MECWLLILIQNIAVGFCSSWYSYVLWWQQYRTAQGAAWGLWASGIIILSCKQKCKRMFRKSLPELSSSLSTHKREHKNPRRISQSFQFISTSSNAVLRVWLFQTAAHFVWMIQVIASNPFHSSMPGAGVLSSIDVGCSWRKLKFPRALLWVPKAFGVTSDPHTSLSLITTTEFVWCLVWVGSS